MRTYTNLFVPGLDELSGIRAAWIRMRAARIAEPMRIDEAMEGPSRLSLVVFEGMGTQFLQLNGHNKFLRDELLAITRPLWREKAMTNIEPFIGIHVRRGDFKRATPTTALGNVDNTTTPISWFVEMLRALRRQSEIQMPAIVTSDGSDAELEQLLSEKLVRRIDTGSALGDLLLLSRSAILLSSGSSFSAWASFLGQMPTLSHPGQSLTRLFGLSNPNGPFLGEAEPANADFLATVLSKAT